METEAVKLLAVALSLLPLIAVGFSMGRIFSSYNEAISRNPTAAQELGGKFILTAVFTEVIALFSLVVALLILFVA